MTTMTNSKMTSSSFERSQTPGRTYNGCFMPFDGHVVTTGACIHWAPHLLASTGNVGKKAIRPN
jgi:hypothetical protein